MLLIYPIEKFQQNRTGKICCSNEIQGVENVSFQKSQFIHVASLESVRIYFVLVSFEEKISMKNENLSRHLGNHQGEIFIFVVPPSGSNIQYKETMPGKFVDFHF